MKMNVFNAHAAKLRKIQNFMKKIGAVECELIDMDNSTLKLSVSFDSPETPAHKPILGFSAQA